MLTQKPQASLKAKYKISLYMILLWIVVLATPSLFAGGMACIDTFGRMANQKVSVVSPLMRRTKTFFNRSNRVIQEQATKYPTFEPAVLKNRRILKALAEMPTPEALTFIEQSLKLIKAQIVRLYEEHQDPHSMYTRANLDLFPIINLLRSERALAEGYIEGGHISYREWTDFSFRLSALLSFPRTSDPTLLLALQDRAPEGTKLSLNSPLSLRIFRELFEENKKQVKRVRHGVFSQIMKFSIAQSTYSLLPFYTTAPPSVKTTNWAIAFGVGYATMQSGPLNFHGFTQFSINYLLHDIGHIFYNQSHNLITLNSKKDRRHRTPMYLNLVPDKWAKKFKGPWEFRRNLSVEQVHFRNYLFRHISSLSQELQVVAQVALFYVGHESGALILPKNVKEILQKNQESSLDSILQMSLDPRESFYLELEALPVSTRADALKYVMDFLVNVSARYSGH